MLGAESLFPMIVTRLTIGVARPRPGAYPMVLVRSPRMAIPLVHWGKSLADDLDRTRYCKR